MSSISGSLSSSAVLRGSSAPFQARGSSPSRTSSRTRTRVRVSCEKSSEEMQEVRTLPPPSRKNLSSMPCSSSFRDWRSFRAALLRTESGLSQHQQQHQQLQQHQQQHQQQEQQQQNQPWAHQISCLEPGSVLLATAAVQRHSLFQNSAILIVETSESVCRGLILNKPMPFSVDDVPLMEPDAVRLAELACPAFVAGPLLPYACKPQLHLLTSSKLLRGYNSVADGIYVGNSHSLGSTLSSVERGLVRPAEVRILVNEVEWERQQLEVEVRAFGWWKIVSCSSDNLLQVPASQIWETLTRHLEQ